MKLPELMVISRVLFTAYHDFKEKLTNLSLNQAEKECIILNVTLFGDDKAILKQRLKKLFPELTENKETA